MLTEAERLQAIALCDELQRTIAKLNVDVTRLKAAVDEFRQTQTEKPRSARVP